MSGAHPSMSIVVPFKAPTRYLRECVAHCLALEYDEFDIVLLPDRKEQKTPLGTRVLDRAHHERLDELAQVDIPGYRLQCTDHGCEIQMLDRRAHRGSSPERRLLFET